jgi:hypothetical protein
MALALLFATCPLSFLHAQAGGVPDAGHARIALFEPAGQKSDPVLAAVLSTVANSVEISLDVLQRYDVRRLPPADPEQELPRVRAYCQANRIDQAILGSGSARAEGGYFFKLAVYDRLTDSITFAPEGSSAGTLDMFEVTDTLVSALLDGLSGRHILFGSLSVETDPTGTTVLVNGREAGNAPLHVRGLPVGEVRIGARAPGYEDTEAFVSITDGESTEARLSLTRSTGILALTVPGDAVVSVRNAEIGQRDFSGPGTTTLPTGDYDVEARCDGMPAVSGKLTIVRGTSAPWLPWPKGYLEVQAIPAGATILVDGVDRGVAPRVVDVEPGMLHRVELTMQKYGPYRAEIRAEAGNKSLLAGALAPLDGSVRVETSIAGAEVTLDDNEQSAKTPAVFDKVRPGQHVVRISSMKVGNRLYTAGEPFPIDVNPGETAVVSKTFEEGRARVTFLDAEPGGIITIEGKNTDSGSALRAPIEVPAGWLDVSVHGPGSQSWTGTVFAEPGSDIRARIRLMAFVPPRQTIPLGAKADSWLGIDPLPDIFPYPTFMRSAGIAMSRAYMARDEENLYWRIDFAEKSPVLSPPKGTSSTINLQLAFQLDSGKQLNLGAYSTKDGRLGSYAALYDPLTRRSQFLPFAEEFWNTNSMLVARLGLDKITQFLKGPSNVVFELGNDNGNGTWSDVQSSRWFMVSLMK